MPPIRTPHIISIVEVVFFGEFYPAVLGIWDGEVYCLDILRDSSEETCGAFLKTLDATVLKDFPLLCPKCKLTHIIDVEKLEIVIKNTEKQTFII